MQDIAELVSVVCRYKPRQINIIDDAKDDKANQLYQMLVDNRELTESEAASVIYGTDKPAAINKLKHRLKDKLFNTLFFIDLRGPKFSDYIKAGLSCYRYMALFFILRRFGANKLASVFGENLVRKAIKFDLAEVSYMVLAELCIFYSSEAFNQQKFSKYKVLLEQEYQKLTDNHLLNKVYAEIMSQYTDTRSSRKQELLDLIEQNLDPINDILATHNSFWLRRKGYIIKTLYYQIEGNLDAALEVCEEAIHYFEHVSAQKSTPTLVNFYLQELNIYLNQKAHIKGRERATLAKSLIPYYSNDWHVISYIEFLLYMNSKEYDRAFKLYMEVTQHKDFKKITPFFIESWSVFEAYVHLVKHKLSEAESLPFFSINRYVNNIPTFSKDKRGNNISILIAHFIFLVEQGKYDNVIDRVDALKQYAHRYLREDSTLRSNCFIKMLLCVVRADFNPIRASRYAEKYLDKLKETPLSVSEQSTEIEIIPYEDLWEIILEILKKNG